MVDYGLKDRVALITGANNPPVRHETLYHGKRDFSRTRGSLPHILGQSSDILWTINGQQTDRLIWQSATNRKVGTFLYLTKK